MASRLGLASIQFAVERRPSLPARAYPFLPLPVNDPLIAAIAERIRSIIARQPGHTLDALASILSVSPDALRQIIAESERTIDTRFLIDVLAALVRELAVDPQWLITGQYDSTIHRRALSMGEDRGAAGARALENFVREQFYRARENVDLLSLPTKQPPE